jgi:hypothetical protein
MSRLDLSSLKTFFEQGDRPNQQDYENLIVTLASQATDLGTFGNNENEISGIENETVVDTFDATVWRMVKYLASISYNSAGQNKFYATELTILIDNQNVNVTEYGVIDNDGDIGTISVSRTGNAVSLVCTPILQVTPVTVRFARMGLKA